MARTPKKHMSKQDIEDWEELYEYVRTNVLGYDETQSLSRNMVLRLKGLANNKFMANNNIKDTANYSYKIILLTFKYCQSSIQRALNSVSFANEQHKFNYILRIVEDNLNTVHTRIKQKKKIEEEAEEFDVSNVANYMSAFKPKQSNDNHRLDDLW